MVLVCWIKLDAGLHPGGGVHRGGKAGTGVMDALVFVQESRNCATTDPFKIFKRRVTERQRDQVSKSNGWKRSLPAVRAGPGCKAELRLKSFPSCLLYVKIQMTHIAH